MLNGQIDYNDGFKLFLGRLFSRLFQELGKCQG